MSKIYVRHFGKGKGELFMYEKPIVIPAEDIAEGVYLASGATANGRPGCDSKYVNGVWHKDNYDGKTYLSHLGCNGCPAFRYNGCGLQVDQAYLDGATSYDADNGNRMPGWEVKGHAADEAIDWNTYDM